MKTRSLGRGDFIEVAVTARAPDRAGRALARNFLTAQGFPEGRIAAVDYKTTAKLCVYLRSFGKLKKIRQAFARLGARGWRLASRVLARRDWLDKWKASYHIFPLGRKFAAVPAWEKKKFRMKNRIPLYLDPGCAFGSGAHETTRLMVRMMEPLAGRFGNFFDAGTGTGILSAAAYHLGAREILGIDTDRPSIKAARENFAANGGRRGRFLCAQLGKLKGPGRFDLAGANLVSGTLIANRGALQRVVKKGGYLVVSGVLRRDLNWFRRSFEGRAWRCLKVLKGRHWIAIAYRRI